MSTKSIQPPLVELGLFARTFVAFAAALIAFSAVACVSIFSMLAYWSITGKMVDFSIAYRVTGLAAGVLMLVVGIAWVIWAGVYRMTHPSQAEN